MNFAEAAGRLFPVTVLPMFEPQPTRVLLLDADKLVAPAGVDWRADLAWTASYVRRQLPVEFHACRCVYYATGSAADLTKSDLGGAEIRMRLGFVLDRPVSTAQARSWLANVEGLDKSTLNPAQPIYCAAPIFRDGLVDPLPERLGVLDGQFELAAVPEITIEQRFKREAFASLGPVRSAEGLGLLKSHPRLDAALDRLGGDAGAAGSVRTGLIRAAFAYTADAGRDHVDIDALAGFLAEVAEQYRSAAEVAGYGIEGLIAWVLERAPDDPPPMPHYPDVGLPADEAIARLRQEMAATIGAAVAWRAVGITADGKIEVNHSPPVVGIKAGAGLGKTGAALEQIAAVPGIEQMNVEIYVPDHRLAQELSERAKRAAPHLRVLVIRGRGANTADGAAMCQKAPLAEQIGKAGLNVMGHLCRLKGKGGAEPQECEFAKTCRYLAQFRENRPAIRILAHASMFVARNKELPEPDLIVIDELFWRDAVSHKRLALDRLTEVGRWHVRPRSTKRAKFDSEEERVAEAFAQVKARKEADDRKQDAEDFARRVRSAFEDGRDPRSVVSAEEAGIVASVEWGSRGGPSITPGMEHKSQINAWQSWQRDECAKAGRFWNLLAAEHDHPDRPIQRIVLERDAPTPDGDRRHLLHLHHRRDLTLPAVPVILLDADLDPVITAKFWPHVRVVQIPVRQQAEIVQVVDRSCSMRFLLGSGDGDQQRADNRLRELERFTGRVLADGGLFVSYKAALDRIKLPAGVDGVHLGNLRGRDSYKHHDVAVIAGRLEPSVGKLEEMARAMFGDEAEALATVTPGDHGGTRYPTKQRCYRTTGGTAGGSVDVSVHPDPRAQAMLEQIREREIEQAVARLRLVHRGRPATVYLLTNLPLNLEIAEVTTWNALARDREAEAVRRWAGVWLCSAERAKAAPDLWPSPGAERMAEREGVRSALIYSRGVCTPFRWLAGSSATTPPLR